MDDIRPPIAQGSTRFLDELRLHIRQNGLAYRTEQTYLFWIKNFIRFHSRQHPKHMGSHEIEAFLFHLAEQRNCSVRLWRGISTERFEQKIPECSHGYRLAVFVSVNHNCQRPKVGHVASSPLTPVSFIQTNTESGSSRWYQ